MTIASIIVTLIIVGVVLYLVRLIPMDATIQKCPNCGGPVTDGNYVKCAYCGVQLNDPTLVGACPDCGSQLEMAEGCAKCHVCGFSECG